MLSARVRSPSAPDQSSVSRKKRRNPREAHASARPGASCTALFAASIACRPLSAASLLMAVAISAVKIARESPAQAGA